MSHCKKKTNKPNSKSNENEHHVFTNALLYIYSSVVWFRDGGWVRDVTDDAEDVCFHALRALPLSGNLPQFYPSLGALLLALSQR